MINKFLVLAFVLILSPFCQGSTNWDEVKEILVDTSELVDYDLSTMISVAYLESSFRTEVQSKGSSAIGLMQITEPTAKHLLSKYGGEYGLDIDSDLMDAEVSSILGALYLKEIQGIMTTRLGRDITPLENYLGYKFSPYRATRMIKANQQMTLLDFYPKAMKRNKSVYFKDGVPRTLAEVKSMFERRFNRATVKYSKEGNYILSIVRAAKMSTYKDMLALGAIDCNLRNHMVKMAEVIFEASLSKPLEHNVLGNTACRAHNNFKDKTYAVHGTGKRYNGFMI